MTETKSDRTVTTPEPLPAGLSGSGEEGSSGTVDLCGAPAPGGRAGRIARAVLTILASCFVVYHLACVLLLPNDTSLQARALSPYLLPYANTLAFHTPWVFFSPGPSPVFYIEYETESRASGEVSEPVLFPPPKASRGFSDRYNRALFSMRYFALHTRRMEAFLVPWLCRRHPDAGALHIRTVVEQVAGIEQKWLGESFTDLLTRMEAGGSGRYPCPADAAESSLPDSGDYAP